MRAAVMSPVVVLRADPVRYNVLAGSGGTGEQWGRDRDPIETVIIGAGVKPVSSD
ncbi:hypothetical protein [Nocardia violaceofusca]|uniref:hypothetical protein n=1 Tax=Nocardia violaceofusca TaxID=941182 RepID=UPI000B0F4087|nr:hypothetical protein [Nocardia violaceofusca]